MEMFNDSNLYIEQAYLEMTGPFIASMRVQRDGDTAMANYMNSDSLIR